MSQSPDSFDPYEAWLEIPPEEQPPSLYRLLGLNDFESDLQVIDTASKKRSAHLHQLAAGPNREVVQGLMNEVAKARRTLMSDDSRRTYDDQLRSGVGTETKSDETDVTVPSPSVQSRASVQPKSSVQPAPSIEAGPAIQVAAGSSSNAGRSFRKADAASARKPWFKNWRVHALSACLLLIGGIAWALNRDPSSEFTSGDRQLAQRAGGNPTRVGDRRSETTKKGSSAFEQMIANSQAAPKKETTSKAPKSSPKTSPKDSPQSPSPSAKAKQKPQPSAKALARRKRQREAAAKRKAESKNSESKNVVKEMPAKKNASEMKPPSLGPSSGASPKPGGLAAIGFGKGPDNLTKPVALKPWASIDLLQKWDAGLVSKHSFDGTMDKGFQYQSNKSAKLKFEDGKLVFGATSAEVKYGAIISKNAKWHPGHAASITTNLAPNDQPVRFGLVYGSVRVALVAEAEKVTVKVKDVLLGEVPKGKGNVTLVLLRHPKDMNQFRWLVHNDEQANTGVIHHHGKMPRVSNVGILYRVPTKPSKSKFWADDLRVGKVALGSLPKTKLVEVDLSEK